MWAWAPPCWVGRTEAAAVRQRKQHRAGGREASKATTTFPCTTPPTVARATGLAPAPRHEAQGPFTNCRRGHRHVAHERDVERLSLVVPRPATMLDSASALLGHRCTPPPRRSSNPPPLAAVVRRRHARLLVLLPLTLLCTACPRSSSDSRDTGSHSGTRRHVHVGKVCPAGLCWTQMV